MFANVSSDLFLDFVGNNLQQIDEFLYYIPAQ